MKKLLLLLVCSFVLVLATVSSGKNRLERSPYSGIDWDTKGTYPLVKVDGKNFRLLGINGESFEKIIGFCKKQYGEDAYKMFSEDLLEIFDKMGKPLGNSVELFLQDLQSGKEIRMGRVPLTRSNRKAIIESREINPNRYIKPSPSSLSVEEVEEDLQQFQNQLENRFSYLKVGNPDYKRAIEGLRKRASEGISSKGFEKELRLIMGIFIDAHSKVIGIFEKNQKAIDRNMLPFHMRYSGSRVVALKDDGSDFLIKGFPFLTTIDGISIEKWVAMGKRFRAEGSMQFQKRQGLIELRNLNMVRGDLGVDKKGDVVVELLSEDLLMRRKVTLELRSVKPGRLRKPGRESGILKGNIGYLRISSFGSKGPAVELIEKWMPEFKDTDGLIVDVRGNGGGSRKGLLALYPYFMSSQDKPRVVNVSTYKLYEGFGKDHLQDRFLYPLGSQRWGVDELDVIKKFKKEFTPQWIPAKGEFSEWHYMVLSKNKGDKRYVYTKPVVILQDDGCLGATDIFLGAMKGWKRNILLMGKPSSGGSAGSQAFILENSSMIVSCASIVSFQPDGFLYDTNGIYPDVPIEPLPESFKEGGKDNILEHAVEFINKGKF